MTHKIALSLALFTSVGTVACSVDAPTRDNFDYSFIEEMPEDIPAQFGFTTAYEGDFELLFRDGLYGTDFVEEKAAEVHVSIDRVMIESIGAEGATTWVSVRSSPIDLDLLALADGKTASLAAGPIPPGHYGSVVFQISAAWVVDPDENKWDLELPGSVLTLDTDFTVVKDEPATLTLDFGGLRSLEFDGDVWYSDPAVTYAFESH